MALGRDERPAGSRLRFEMRPDAAPLTRESGSWVKEKETMARVWKFTHTIVSTCPLLRMYMGYANALIGLGAYPGKVRVSDNCHVYPT